MAKEGFSIEIEQIENYRFSVRFAEGTLVTDEPPPAGQGAGPHPAELLAAAVANCLMASLLFCLTKARATPEALKARVQGHLARDTNGRLRVAALDVALTAPGATPRCLTLFENYCVVTESVRAGVPVNVAVTDEHGRVLHESRAPDQTSRPAG